MPSSSQGRQLKLPAQTVSNSGSTIVLHILYSLIYDYSDIKAVVDAFGFGGTLVGILVGFIAIIYAFYQGSSQHQTNETMIIEIGKLNTVKEEIGDTANLLKEQLTTLTDITTKITEIDLNVNNSNMQLTELNRQFSTFPNGNSSVKQSSESSAAEPLNSISLLKNYIAGRGQVYLCLDAYVLRNVANLTSLNNHAKKMYHVMHTEAPSVYTEDNSDDYLQTLQTLTAMLNLILTLYRAAGLITLDVKSEESEQNLKWIMVSGKESDINVLRTALLAEANTVHKPIIKMLFDAK